MVGTASTGIPAAKAERTPLGRIFHGHAPYGGQTQQVGPTLVWLRMRFAMLISLPVIISSGTGSPATTRRWRAKARVPLVTMAQRRGGRLRQQAGGPGERR